MTETYLLPGVSYAHSLAEGIAGRAHPRNPQPVIDAARREARNLSRLITWAIVPLAKGEEAAAFVEIAARLARFGGETETVRDFPETPDPTATLAAQFDELARRVEEALLPLKKGGAR